MGIWEEVGGKLEERSCELRLRPWDTSQLRKTGAP